MSRDGTRAKCLREIGDLLSVGADLESVWLQNYVRNSLALPAFKTTIDLMNLHDKRYCSVSSEASWCCPSSVPLDALALPNWNIFEQSNIKLEMGVEYSAVRCSCRDDDANGT